jgi:hypothetical protein
MDNVLIALIILLGLCAAGIMICCFLKLSKEKQIEMIKQWLLLAVIEAEKQLGSGTGTVKLRYVYDMFIKRFKFMSKLITFEMFSQLVDEVLETMRHLIETNQSIAAYINK